MHRIIQDLEQRQLRADRPRFKPGDTVRVHFQVIEGTRRRVQVFEGIVLKRQGAGARETFTVRKQSFGIGVERTFPLHSPKIEKIEVAAIGDVNRASLYYLRARSGPARATTLRNFPATTPRPPTTAISSLAGETDRPEAPALRSTSRRAFRRRHRRGGARLPRRPARGGGRPARLRLAEGSPRPAAGLPQRLQAMLARAAGGSLSLRRRLRRVRRRARDAPLRRPPTRPAPLA